MDELIAFAKACLDEDEATANPTVCGCLDANHIPYCTPKPHLDRLRREVAAKRAVLAWYADSVDAAALFKEKLGTGSHMAVAAGSYLNVIRGFVAASWPDRPGYRPEWAPGGEASGERRTSASPVFP